MITARAVTNETGQGFIARADLHMDPLYQTFVSINYDSKTDTYKHKVSNKNIGPRAVIQNYAWTPCMNDLLMRLSRG